jgi:hypothetical protein
MAFAAQGCDAVQVFNVAIPMTAVDLPTWMHERVLSRLHA